MRSLYVVAVWLHILAAAIWVGGMLFLVLVVAPWLRGAGKAHAVVVLREAGRRFRVVGWACFGVLLVTGSFALWMRGVRPESFVTPGWLGSAFGRVVLAKLGLFAVIVGVSALHDFYLGPRASALLERDRQSAAAQRLRRHAAWLGRLNAVLGVVIVLVAVVLVRGIP